MLRVKIISLSSHGAGLSGGDRIWIELADHWSKKNSVEVITWNQGYQMFKRQKDKIETKLRFKILKKNLFNSNYLVSYISRIIVGISWAIETPIDKPLIIYSSSEFWMDLFPALIIKLRNKKNTWVATWYQTAPSPLKGYSFFYWISQLVVKPFIKYFADYVLVNNELERDQFFNLSKSGRVVVVLGGVDTNKTKSFKLKAVSYKKYDAVFQGRFHPQKGVVELISIWKEVCRKKPNAKLVMIGDGPMMGKVKLQIQKYKLQNNIELKGYLFDGDEKYRIFSQSKIVVHPSIYDSGGMAAGEAMAFGIPIVGFNLPAYKNYYPKGMVKAKFGDGKGFSRMIIKLLENSKLRNKLGLEGQKYIYNNWSWEKRAEEVLTKII